MSKIKQYIGLFCLSIFIFIKIAGLHALSHFEEDKDNGCQICEYVITANEHSFLIDTSTFSEILIKIRYKQKEFHKYAYTYFNNHNSFSLFGRPPPIF